MMWSAFILGLMGSVHCLAMCGPLVAAINSNRRQTVLEQCYYNTGRIFTYGILGVLAGIFGTGIKWAVGQQFLSILSGVLLLSGLLINWVGSKNHTSWMPKILVQVKLRMSSMLNGRSRNMWWFGVFNGLLPCGLVYVALAAAISTGSLSKSIIYMLLFGIGTSPMMWMIASSIQKFKVNLVTGNQVVRVFTWLLAILLIIRGLDLGVPYLSPEVGSDHTAHMTVCN